MTKKKKNPCQSQCISCSTVRTLWQIVEPSENTIFPFPGWVGMKYPVWGVCGGDRGVCGDSPEPPQDFSVTQVWVIPFVLSWSGTEIWVLPLSPSVLPGWVGMTQNSKFWQSGLRKEGEAQSGVFVVFVEPGQWVFPWFAFPLPHLCSCCCSVQFSGALGGSWAEAQRRICWAASEEKPKPWAGWKGLSQELKSPGRAMILEIWGSKWPDYTGNWASPVTEVCRLITNSHFLLQAATSFGFLLVPRQSSSPANSQVWQETPKTQMWRYPLLRVEVLFWSQYRNFKTGRVVNAIYNFPAIKTSFCSVGNVGNNLQHHHCNMDSLQENRGSWEPCPAVVGTNEQKPGYLSINSTTAFPALLVSEIAEWILIFIAQ